MIGTRSRMSLRSENLDSMDCPVAPIGPDGETPTAAVAVGPELMDAAGSEPAFSDAAAPEAAAGFCSDEICAPPGKPAFVPLPCGPSGGAEPVEGCVEAGIISAARASAGVGIFLISAELDGAGCSIP